MRVRSANRSLPRVCSKCALPAEAYILLSLAKCLIELRYDSLERAVKEAPSGVSDTKVQKFVNGIVMTEKVMLQVVFF